VSIVFIPRFLNIQYIEKFVDTFYKAT